MMPLEWTQIGFQGTLISTSIIATFFLPCLLLLVWIQCNNFATNQTTNQRFSKFKRSDNDLDSINSSTLNELAEEAAQEELMSDTSMSEYYTESHDDSESQIII